MGQQDRRGIGSSPAPNGCGCGERPYRYDRRALDNKLKGLCETLASETGKHEGMWNSINRRVPYYVFFTVLGGLFAITVGLMGIVYHQGGKTQDIVVSVHAAQEGMAQMIRSNSESVREIRRQLNERGG